MENSNKIYGKIQICLNFLLMAFNRPQYVIQILQQLGSKLMFKD